MHVSGLIRECGIMIGLMCYWTPISDTQTSHLQGMARTHNDPVLARREL